MDTPPQPDSEVEVRQKRLSALELANAKKITDKKMRKLKKPPEREEYFFWWMSQFHITTRALQLYLGATETDLSNWHKKGWIKYENVSFKATSQTTTDDDKKSCLFLTNNGIKRRRELVRARLLREIEAERNEDGQKKGPRQVQIEFKQRLVYGHPAGDTHISHDLMLSAFIAWLVVNEEITTFLGPASIRGGALKLQYYRILYKLVNKLEITNFWSFDACIMRKGVPLALEYERTPKKDYEDLERFFRKIHENADFNCAIAVLCETPGRVTEVKAHLEAWRTVGFPYEKKVNNKPVVTYKKLDDGNKTGARLLPKEILLEILETGRKKNGKSGKRMPRAPLPDFEALKALQAEAKTREKNLGNQLRLEGLLKDLSDLDYEQRSASQYEGKLAPELYQEFVTKNRHLRFLVLTDEELSGLIGADAMANPEVVRQVWLRDRAFRKLVAAAQQKPAERGESPPPQKKRRGLLSFLSDDEKS